MEYHNQSFQDTDIVLDGNDYYDCQFANCNLIYRGGEPPDIRDCSFSGCRVTFEGSAGNTVTFLTKLYHGGFKRIIEHTLDNIRANRLPDNPIGH